MASKRRKGRPRKPGHRYRNGKLRPSHEPPVSPAAIAATQPHRKGLGDCAADQKAESELGRLALRGQVTALQYLAGQRYAAQWRAYLATLDGPRSPQRGQGRGNGCNPADCRERGANCACDLARRLWTRSVFALTAAHPQAILVTARVCCWDVPCPPWALPVLRCGLDALAESLGLTTRNKSEFVKTVHPNHVQAEP
jgi:hypothetical protein